MVDAPNQMPTKRSLVWLFVRWTPAVLLTLCLTPWSLVMLDGTARVVGWSLLLALPGTAFIILGPVLAYAIIKRRFSPPMAVACLLGLVVLWPIGWPSGFLAFPFPVDDATKQDVVSVRLPSASALLVYAGGDALDVNHHALYPDQRFGYDFVIEPALHQKPRLEDYGCYGTEVLAPLTATVAIAFDGAPDVLPGSLENADQPYGNVVVLEIEDGTHLILAHLKQGSVAVKSNQIVSEGDVLGECGNSGHTSEPHIHLHRQRELPSPANPPGVAVGLPLRFRNYAGPKEIVGGVDREGGRLIARGVRLRPM